MVFLENIWTELKFFISTAGLTLLEAVSAVMLGIAIIRVVMRLVRGALLRSKLENSIASFLLSVLNATLYIVLLVVVLSIFKIPLTSFIAILSATGLAISLALQNSLSNIANGLVIIATKPFKEGDFVEVGSVAGTVKSIKMLNTKVVTPDNKIVTVPNSTIINSNVINFNSKEIRRVDMTFAVSYASDLGTVKAAIFRVIAKNPDIFDTPDPSVRLKEHGASALIFTVKVWTATSNYWDVLFSMNEEVFEEFRRQGIEIPFNQIDVNLKNLPNGVLADHQNLESSVQDLSVHHDTAPDSAKGENK